MSGMTVGFVGLGAMGQGMAASLLRAGHVVRVWNRSPGPVAALVAQGAEAADGPADAFAAQVVVSMLANDEAVERLLLDPALLAGAAASVHVNTATVSVALAERAAALHAEHGLGYVAAPVLGRPPVAAAGELNILAAGSTAALAAAEPLLAAMGRRTWYFGERPPQANTAKISANFLLACAIESMAEACSLAEANGVRPADLIEMLSGTLFPARSTPATARWSPSAATNRPASGCLSASRTSTSRSPRVPTPTYRCPSAASCGTPSSTRSRTGTARRTGPPSRPSPAAGPGSRSSGPHRPHGEDPVRSRCQDPVPGPGAKSRCPPPHRLPTIAA